ncbi:hypothetical protein DICVIV_06025 [Dictyocaulus viviparus]|uniref:Uncharacterized protein n=1 Tax=Dictyocaulus viviparus TaxID=29172 RepID=A0A0D8XVQ0_DICVI|nr:hypothetical protein DICVIV_06025 [Dictyocaulus viviparus]
MIVTLLFVLISLPLTISYCAQCASVSLLNQWQLTGLQHYPANLPFTPKCATIASDDTLLNSMNVTKCSSVCFEMVVPFENEYHFVRGCHDDFASMPLQQATSLDNKCIYSKINNQYVDIDAGNGGLTTVRPVAVVHFVKTSGSEITNAKITIKTLNDNNPPFLNRISCKEAKNVTCVKSIYYDGRGEKTNKNTCNGGICTSVVGTLNGREFVERGCAPISPYMNDICLPITTNTTIPSGPGDGAIRCNSSTDKSLYLALVTITFTFVRFFY